MLIFSLQAIEQDFLEKNWFCGSEREYINQGEIDKNTKKKKKKWVEKRSFAEVENRFQVFLWSDASNQA